MSVDGVMVANAALAEVGLPQTAFRRDGSLSIRVSTRIVNVPIVRGLRLTYRAGVLGSMAEKGADTLVRCHDCGPNADARGTVPCTPARDALRGITCGGAE